MIKNTVIELRGRLHLALPVEGALLAPVMTAQKLLGVSLEGAVG